MGDAPERKRDPVKIGIGALFVLSQLIRQPGFGFDTSGGYSDQILGYDLFAAAMYVAGLWLIYRGLRPKKQRH
jgi:hypothetical protein